MTPQPQPPTLHPLPMPINAVMFDLDGTLLDTLDDIATAANELLVELEVAPLQREKYLYLIGRGARWLLEQALPSADEQLIDRALPRYQEIYANLATSQTRAYDGIAELLDTLSSRNDKLAVLSNKPHPATVRAVDRFLGRWHFDAVQGQVDELPLKPDPTVAIRIAKKLNVPVARWLYVGDTEIDMATARSAGMRAVGVLWGFRSEEELRDAGAQHLVRQPSEILQIMSDQAAGPSRP